jgi:lipopolysaccharide heptosyltransferase II
LKEKDKGIAGLLHVGEHLSKRSFDIVIDLQNNRASHALAFLSRAPHRYGYDNRKWGFFLNHRLENKKDPVDPLTHQFRVLALAGIDSKDKRLELWPSEDDARYVHEALSAQWLSSQQRLVGINVSASRRWTTKSLPFEHLVKVCEALGSKDIRAVLTGAQDDVALAHRLSAKLKTAKPIIMCGKTTVNQLACLIRKCAVFISGDSAPLHIAAAVGTPFVAIFGPTDARRHVPPAKRCVILHKDIPCSPCYKSKCANKRCMELIRPEEIVAAVEKLLK